MTRGVGRDHTGNRSRHRRRWIVLLSPLVLPWVLVSFPTGWYALFSVFWIDPGPRVVTMVAFLSRTTVTVWSRSFVLAWPLAFGLYALALGSAYALPTRRRLAGALLWSSGLAVGFHALGLWNQPDIAAFPVGLLVLWLAAANEIRHGLDGTE